MDTVRRLLTEPGGNPLTEAGEPLLAPQPPSLAAARWEAFMQAFGLGPDEVVISPLVTMPLPRYPQVWPDSRRRWPGVRPEFMWHPLMWLPPRLAGLAVLERDPATGEPSRLESQDHWAVRVMVELSFAGLYDVASGAWLDVMSLHGLDIASADVQARVAGWLDGADDPVLDGIDLSANFDVAGDPWWALDAAADIADSLWVVSWVLAAEDLSGALEDVVASLDAPGADTATTLGRICATAQTSFEYLPGPNPDAAGEWEFWSETTAALSQLDCADLDAVREFVAPLSQRLSTVRESFWAEIVEYAEHARQVEAGLGISSVELTLPEVHRAG